MKKKSRTGNSELSRPTEDQGLGPLVTELRSLIQSARQTAATTVNALQVLTNFEIGRRIVEHEQKGAERAEYGKELLKVLSAQLTGEFGNGFSERNLEYMRKFFLLWRERQSEISQTSSAKLLPQDKISQTPPAQWSISQTLSGKSGNPPFTLSWSHYVLVTFFYMLEPIKGTFQ
jgi:hypothetical protein